MSPDIFLLRLNITLLIQLAVSHHEFIEMLVPEIFLGSLHDVLRSQRPDVGFYFFRF